MRPRSFLWSTSSFVFLLFILFVRAVPAEKDTTTSPLSTALPPDTTPTPTQATHSTTRPEGKSPNDGDGDKPSRSTSHTLAILSATPHTHHNPQTPGTGTLENTKTYIWPPHTQRPTAAPQGASNTTGHGQSTLAIVSEVLGGAVLLFILMSLGRCLYSYRRAPQRDRIGALLNRHQLQREMEEMERDRVDRFRQMMESTSHQWRPPPPPYQHAPAYESVVGSDGEGSIDWGRPSVPPRTHPPTP
ncbi:hypothetical protein C8Q80DRAFT_1154928 [Daedaleopsis nitida]|nr:hypothetical protein C8Q80DRAFT_1154928 [Daedaleopsis nitida]